MKRIVLFLLTNLAVMLVLSIVLSVLGVNRYMGGQGGMAGLLVFAISRVSEPWMFYATYVPARALAEPLLVSVVPRARLARCALAE